MIFLLWSANIFKSKTFLKKYFRNTITVSNSLDPDQDRRSVGPDLGPNCLQKLSADNTSRQRVKSTNSTVLVVHSHTVMMNVLSVRLIIYLIRSLCMLLKFASFLVICVFVKMCLFVVLLLFVLFVCCCLKMTNKQYMNSTRVSDLRVDDPNCHES